MLEEMKAGNPVYDRMLNTPQAEIEKRIAGLQRILVQQGLDAALILQKVDLFYFTGTLQNASLYVPAIGEPLLMVNKVLARANAESSIGHTVNPTVQDSKHRWMYAIDQSQDTRPR